jgi:hypothetical protein
VAVIQDERAGRESLRELLSRPRRHQLIDFLLGFGALLALASWIANLSAVLALAVFLLGGGAYVASRWRREHVAEDGPASGAAASLRSAPITDPVSVLETRLAAARPIPLTGRVRMNREEIVSLVEGVRAAAANSPATAEAEKLARAVLSGGSVPFTDQVRIDRRRANRSIQRLRTQLQ